MEERGDIPLGEARRALELLRGALAVLPEDGLRSLRFTAHEAARRGLHLAHSAERELRLFIDTYREPPLEVIQSMRARSLAIVGAEIHDSAGAPPLTPPPFSRARALREKHLKLLDAVFFDNGEVQSMLRSIRCDRCHRDLGEDLIDLASMELGRWEGISTKGLTSRDEVEEMDRLGVALLDWVKRDDPTRSREMEQRAWTHMHEAYNIIRDHAFVIHRHDPELYEQAYPDLFAVSLPSPLD